MNCEIWFQVFRDDPDGKCVYIAPLKALVRERISDWKIRFEQKLGKKVVELTGDITPDVRAILQASVIGKGNKNIFSNHQIALRSIFKNLVKWQQDLKISSNGNKI